MRVVLVNWARIWDGASVGGGVNGYCQSLALELVKRGHEVVSLFGGTTFVPTPTPDRTSPCFVRRHEDWLGVRVFEVVNSPVMAPSIIQYQRPMDEVSSPELEGEVERLLGHLKPDVVHFHNIEGFSIGCVRAARRAGAKVFFSLHNYHTICPQVYLMQGHRRVCHDSRRGHLCTTCIKTKDPAVERRELAEAYGKLASPASPAGRRYAAFMELQRLREERERVWGGFKHEFTWPVRVVKKGLELVRLRREIERAASREREQTGMPGYAVESADDATRPLPCRSAAGAQGVAAGGKDGVDPRLELRPQFRVDDERGQTQAIMQELNALAGPTGPDPRDREPLLNVIQPDGACAGSEPEPNDYGRRRDAMVGMLSSCDRVLAVSNFVREKFVSMGVRPEVIRAMAIGSRINQVVQQARALVFDPPVFPEEKDAARGGGLGARGTAVRPIRLVFMGYNNYYKGLHILIEALEMLTPEYLRGLDVSIYALDGAMIEWAFRRLEPRLARLTFVAGYTYHDIPWILGGKDLGVVPSVWWDNAPQTVFEFLGCGVPVLGAAVGGIPDFVVDGHNGMLFRGNDACDLARRLAEVVREPWRLTAMRANVRPPKGIEEHVTELEALYRAASAGARGGGAKSGSEAG